MPQPGAARPCHHDRASLPDSPCFECHQHPITKTKTNPNADDEVIRQPYSARVTRCLRCGDKFQSYDPTAAARHVRSASSIPTTSTLMTNTSTGPDRRIEPKERSPMAGQFVVWVNNVAWQCHSLIAAQHIANRLQRRGRDIFICGPHLRHTVSAPDSSEMTRSIPKQRLGRLLYFPATQRLRKRAS
jgi:hypothetical protein